MFPRSATTHEEASEAFGAFFNDSQLLLSDPGVTGLPGPFCVLGSLIMLGGSNSRLYKVCVFFFSSYVILCVAIFDLGFRSFASTFC